MAVHELLGRKLNNRYIIEKVLGAGGMGVVFEAYDIKNKAKVAVKTFREPNTINFETIDRFIKEAKIQKKLKHPNIIEVYEIFAHKSNTGNLYLCYSMELLPGEPIENYIKKFHPLTREEIVNIFTSILDGLHYAHKNKVIHRDINYRNIIVDGKNKPHKLIDFGIAKVLGDLDITHTQSFIGTPYFGSPEMVKNPRNVTPLSDIYSLGAVLYYAIENKLPVKGDSPYEVLNNIVKVHIPKIQRLPEFDAIVKKATAKHPEDRFQSALEFQQALLKLIKKDKITITTNNNKKVNWILILLIVNILLFMLTIFFIIFL